MKINLTHQKSISLIIILLSLFILPQINILKNDDCNFLNDFNSKNIITIDDKELNLDFYHNREININENTFFSLPTKITPSYLTEGQYTIAQDLDGRLYCVWIQKTTTTRNSIYYSISSNNSGIFWSNPILLFNTESKIYSINAIVDYNYTLHVFFQLIRGLYTKIIHLVRYEGDSSLILYDVYLTNLFRIDNLKLGITRNNTINIAWIAKSKDSSYQYWDSHIGIARYNITTEIWSSEKWIVQNSTNPITFDMVASYENLRLCWSTSSNFSNVQDLLFSTYNESSNTWTSSKLLTNSDKAINYVNIETSLDGGSHILWRKEELPYSLNYIKIASNESITNSTSRLNNENLYSDCGYIIEVSTGDLYLIFEDLFGYDSQLYYRKKLALNETWTEPILINPTGDCFDLKVFKTYNDTQRISNIFYLYLGSIYTKIFNLSEQWSDEINTFYGLNKNLYPSAVVDQDGIIHLMSYHSYFPKKELIYQQKYPNETNWRLCSIIPIESEVNPKLIFNPDGILNCYIVKKDMVSGYNSIFYLYKDDYDNNWSNPQLAFTTTNNIYQYDKIVILFDSEGQTYLIWKQFYQGRLYINYTYKNQSSNIFQAPIRLENSQENSDCYHCFGLIDEYNTIHLAYCEYNYELEKTYLVYLSKMDNEIWSKHQILTYTNDWIFTPKMIQDSTGKIELIFNEADLVVPNHDYFWTDFKIFEKISIDSNWIYKGTFLRDTGAAGFYDIVMDSNDVLYLIFYEGDYSGSWYGDVDLEQFGFMYRENNQWSDFIILNDIDHNKGTPIFICDESRNQLYIIHQYENTLDWYSLQNDTDNDYLGDFDELFFGTSPINPDTDLDGLLDGYELKISFTNPLLIDTDWDTISDGDEILIYFSNPLSMDTDKDQLEDQIEILIYGSDPTKPDTDGDFLTDYFEVIYLGSDPTSADTDSDGMPDNWEFENSLNLLIDDSLNDEDNDLLNNLGEFLSGTEVYNPDTDNDNLMDGEEVHYYKTNPLKADSDFDTLTDWEEIMIYKTNPLEIDSDFDGFSDKEEIIAGTNPLDPLDNPRVRTIKKILLSTIIPLILLVFISILSEVRYQYRTKKIKEIEKFELDNWRI